VVTANAVELTAVTKRFGGIGSRKADALRGVTVAFPKGSFTAVMGLSGSGKSTLLQVAAGLDRVTSGTVRLGGVDLSGLNRRRLSVLRRRRVGFVFQALNLVPTLTVAENIALPLRLDGRHADRRAVRELAGRVGIADLLLRLPDTLSGGQQQRVAIARALITSPEVIFADEPTAALDPCTSEAIVALFRRAVSELGQTVVLVTHEPTVAACADRVVVLDAGLVTGQIPAPDAATLHGMLRHRHGAQR
jgi:putative ABC transport system ATP-binding protein